MKKLWMTLQQVRIYDIIYVSAYFLFPVEISFDSEEKQENETSTFNKPKITVFSFMWIKIIDFFYPVPCFSQWGKYCVKHLIEYFFSSNVWLNYFWLLFKIKVSMLFQMLQLSWFFSQEDNIFVYLMYFLLATKIMCL